MKIQVGKTMRRRHDARSIVDLVNKINAPEGVHLVMLLSFQFHHTALLHYKIVCNKHVDFFTFVGVVTRVRFDYLYCILMLSLWQGYLQVV